MRCNAEGACGALQTAPRERIVAVGVDRGVGSRLCWGEHDRERRGKGEQEGEQRYQVMGVLGEEPRDARMLPFAFVLGGLLGHRLRLPKNELARTVQHECWRNAERSAKIVHQNAILIVLSCSFSSCLELSK
jgi:hypothetical protein